MKTLLSFRKTALVGFSVATLLARTAHVHAESGYVAHEWGTFTSVQGGDGVQLDWQAKQLSELPRFVYDWSKAGLVRADVMTKNSMVARQRMETPVIYFYADHEQSVDVSVRFPQGFITEWFPQAAQIGPVIGKAASPDVIHPIQGASDSRIDWPGVKILPAKGNSGVAALIPVDQSGSHYFAARATDSTYLRTGLSQRSFEHEKFLFYRGVGNFNVPLQVFADSDQELTLSNTISTRLTHVFVLKVQDRKGALVHLEGLAGGELRKVQLNSDPLPRAELMMQIGRAMSEALVSDGLYPREAAAMVDTWQDSWFAEDGVRVLYLLPRSWTDARLPLALTPPPRELVRVMVGRSEVLTPALETTLIKTLNAASRGDQAARQNAVGQLRGLGRFADPALRLARLHGSTNAASLGYQLLNPPPPSVALTFE